MKVKKWVALLLAGTMALSAAGCGGTKDTASSSADESRVTETAANAGENSQAAETNAENSNYGGTLKIGLQNAIVHLGYVHTGLGTSEAMILDTCCEHLCRYAEDGTLTPWLCTAYEEDPDNLTLTVHLREGIKFHDGSDFNAEAVVWNWQEWTNAGNIELNCVDNYEIIDDHTVVVHLSEWSNNIATSCLYTAGIIVSAEYAKANGTDALDKNPVGTGAFKFEEWVVDEKIVFKANEDYWIEGLPYLDGIEFAIIPDEAAQISAFQTGEIDVLLNCNSDASRTLKEAGFTPEAKSLISGGMSFMFWFSCQDDGPMGNVDARRAVCSAIDKDAIVNYIKENSGAVIERTAQWGPNDVWSANPDLKGYPYDPEAAREYLKAAGYPDGFDMIIYYGNGGDDEEICSLAQSYLAEVGINAKLELIDSTITNELSGINGESFNGMIFSAGRAEVDLTTYYNRTFLPDGVRWVNQVTHEEDIVELINLATTCKTFEEKEKYCQELSKTVIDDYCELMPLYISSDTIFTHGNLVDHGIYQINAIIWTPESAYLTR
ncbi:ABC transporter substrate-binding protein [Eisenbergiella porci]|uniref:ABC transporter substrate-binding protein n=1 Tax=Eisenbergiella porci TaxID=2652274 RepID=UPI0022E610E8|nr:ABC transporter substrate-binding protein [Eisenbergiella porci]